MSLDSERRTYQFLFRLGEGGNGVVYLAVAHGPGGVQKLVALKACKEDGAGASEALYAEARIASLLNHPNLIQTFGTVVLRGRPWIVMEFLEGQTLQRVLQAAWKKRGSLPLPITLRIVRDLLRGLEHAHELVALDGRALCLVHRDVTPQNVFVTFDAAVKVIDFGIVKTWSSAPSAQVEVVQGKLNYMAPEQLAKELLDRRADLFGAGVIMWEALTNQRMWKDAAVGEVLNAVCQGRLRSPRELNPNLPLELERICMKALASDRERRYYSAAAFQADLEEFGLLATDAELASFITDLFPGDRLRTQAHVALGLAKRERVSKSSTSLPRVNALDFDSRLVPCVPAPPQDAVTASFSAAL